MFRFTIRDLFWLTLVAAVSFAGIANLRQAIVLTERWSTAVWNNVSGMAPPLMGRKSVKEWDAGTGTE